MLPDDRARLVEFYSNAIVSFIILQGLAFCYAFGSQETFNKKVKDDQWFVLALALVLCGVWLAAAWAIRRLREFMLAALTDPIDRDLMHKIYAGKIAVICIFGPLPIALLVWFGALYR
jgi:phosphoglycerol transferase MdoB-like AlkP superfamily enzyme